MSDTEKGYNGWHNYETWSVALIVDNDQGLYGQRQDMAQDAWEDADDDERPDYFTRSQAARYAFASAIEEWVKDQTTARVHGYEANARTPDDFSMLAQQLVQAALSEVDWAEIADNWLSETDGYETLSAQRKRQTATA